jgi:hypothetical protein
MIEDLRFIKRDGRLILQMQPAEFITDVFGVFLGTQVGEWRDVPLLEDEQPA